MASVLDLGSRRLIGYALDEHMRTDLVLNALRMAIDARGGHVHGVIAHADRGTQYTSYDYLEFCADRHLRPSVGRTGVCYDNSVAESFWASLKRECLQGRLFATRAEARRAVLRWIHWYNDRRIHTTSQRHPTHQVGTPVRSSLINPVRPTGRCPTSNCPRPPDTKLRFRTEIPPVHRGRRWTTDEDQNGGDSRGGPKSSRSLRRPDPFIGPTDRTAQSTNTSQPNTATVSQNLSKRCVASTPATSTTAPTKDRL
jgi:hypothetical protein